MDFVLVPFEYMEDEDAAFNARQSTGTAVPIEELNGQPVLSFTEEGVGPRESYEIVDVESDLVTVVTNRASYLLPANMPIAVSSVMRKPKNDPRAVDTGIDLDSVHHGAGWILAADLAWNDGLFWAPDHSFDEGSDSVDDSESTPRLRWLELVSNVSPYKPGKTASRLQVLTAPSYFIASNDHDPYGILVSGVLTVTSLPKREEPAEEPVRVPSATPRKRTTKKI